MYERSSVHTATYCQNITEGVLKVSGEVMVKAGKEHD